MKRNKQISSSSQLTIKKKTYRQTEKKKKNNNTLDSDLTIRCEHQKRQKIFQGKTRTDSTKKKKKEKYCQLKK